jgi:chromosome partitioning protein
MLKFAGSSELRRIVFLNPKGGSGKSTLSFNCAGYLASRGWRVALVDMDVQGSSLRWLANRSSELEPILGIRGTDVPVNRHGDQVIKIPNTIDIAIVDAPAGLRGGDLVDYTAGAHAILVPVLPSDLDVHAASRLVSELLLDAGVSRRNGRLGVIANRVNTRTIAYSKLMTFLERLSITVVGSLRQSQNYVHSAAFGRSIQEMPESQVRKDLAQWQEITEWLEQRIVQPLTPRDLLRPEDDKGSARATAASSPFAAWRAPLAAAVGVVAVGLLYLFAGPQGHDAADEVIQSAGQAPSISEPMAADPPATEDAAVGMMLASEPLRDASAELRDKWQVSGIVQTGQSSVLLIKERNGSETRQVGVNGEFDGWTVKQMGEDFAVVTHNGEEVRLILSKERI